jgi:hypothetical protein
LTVRKGFYVLEFPQNFLGVNRCVLTELADQLDDDALASDCPSYFQSQVVPKNLAVEFALKSGPKK